MGNNTSASCHLPDLTEELLRPLDGSDVDSPRGETARKEVARLRAILQELAGPEQAEALMRERQERRGIEEHRIAPSS